MAIKIEKVYTHVKEEHGVWSVYTSFGENSNRWGIGAAFPSESAARSRSPRGRERAVTGVVEACLAHEQLASLRRVAGIGWEES